MKFLDVMLTILLIIGLALVGLGSWSLISVFLGGLTDIMFLFGLLLFLNGLSYVLFIIVTRRLIKEKVKK
jgi:hypothetical protein